MSDPKWTPGPWAYRPEEYDDWGYVRGAPDSDGARWVICQARSPYKTQEELAAHRIDGTDPWEATARLIAASPDLYDAMAEAMAELDALDFVTGPTIDKARDALAKARGEA